MSALSLSQLARDFRSAVRALVQARAFAAVAIIEIGLGVGLLTTMFAVVDAVSLRKLDVADPDSLINVVSLREGREAATRYSLFECLQTNLDEAESVSATDNTVVPITYNGQTVPAFTLSVTGDYYRTMRVRPLLGRTLTRSDEGLVAVISDRFWKRIGGDNGIIGKMVVAGSVPLVIVGIVPASGHESWRFAKAEVVVPFRTGMLLQDAPSMDISQQGVYVTARLKSPLSIVQIQRKLESLWPQFLADTIPPGQSLQEWTRTAGTGVRVLRGNRGFVWTDASLSRSTGLLFLLAGVAFLTMCSNIAALFLSRGLSRNREYAVRMALGATRGDVVRIAVMEGFSLSFTAVWAAIVLTSWLVGFCSKALQWAGPPGFLGADYGLRVDGRVFAFAMSAAFVTGVVAQIFVALRFSKIDVVESLRSGGKSVTDQHRGRKAILAIQVAAAVVLVSGAVLLVSSVKRLVQERGGFQTDGVQIFTLAGKARYSEAGPEFFHQLLTRVRDIPSVTSVGLADRVPMELGYDMAEPIAAPQGNIDVRVTSDKGCAWPGFFESLKIPIIAGREFHKSDRNVTILTKGLGEALFPRISPVGKLVRVGRPPNVKDYEVIGIIGDVPFRSPRQLETRMFFTPCLEAWRAPQTRYTASLAVRAQGRPAEIDAAVRREIDSLGKYWIYQTMSWEEIVAKSTRKESILAIIASGFGAFTLILACAGVYALVELTIIGRRREIGIRIALGANRKMILHFILRDFARVITVGACVGLPFTFVLARLGRAIFYEVGGVQPFLVTAGIAAVVGTSLAVALARAWGTTRMDPGSILRSSTD